MAKKTDPWGLRTLAVLTQVDNVNNGIDVKTNLVQPEVPLTFGYVGVKNRNQLDLARKEPTELVLKRERDYFATHVTYSTISQGHLGIEVLVEKLTSIIFLHIRHFLPNLLREIDEKMQKCEEKLAKLALKSTRKPEKSGISYGI